MSRPVPNLSINTEPRGADSFQLRAPQVRDGRMDKFYWSPERDEIVAILLQMYKARRIEGNVHAASLCLMTGWF